MQQPEIDVVRIKQCHIAAEGHLKCGGGKNGGLRVVTPEESIVQSCMLTFSLIGQGQWIWKI